MATYDSHKAGVIVAGAHSSKQGMGHSGYNDGGRMPVGTVGTIRRVNDGAPNRIASKQNHRMPGSDAQGHSNHDYGVRD